MTLLVYRSLKCAFLLNDSTRDLSYVHNFFAVCVYAFCHITCETLDRIIMCDGQTYNVRYCIWAAEQIAHRIQPDHFEISL